MKSTTRILLLVLLTLAAPAVLIAQEETAAAPAPTTTTEQNATTTAKDAANAPRDNAELEPPTRDAVRSMFTRVVERTPELASILLIDPSLLSDGAFMTRYPNVAEFVNRYPEIRRNPRYYLAAFEQPVKRSLVSEILDEIFDALVFILIFAATAWLIHTVIDQKRWTQLARTQAEVHNKILDRFGSTEELLAYVRTPAGSKFLESAPIPLHPERPSQNAPLTRVLWSVQFGVIVAVAALGMLLISGRFDKDSSEGLFAMGMIGLSIGVGFIASAAVSIVLSRRLGVWQPKQADEIVPES